jgi:hypothetical protein
MNDGRPAATIMIVSKNRRDDLSTAIASAFAQDVPVEVRHQRSSHSPLALPASIGAGGWRRPEIR